MHQALYRKWRPRIFDDVCGQEHITSILKYAVNTATFSHAYLFCGSRGTGKTTCAKILAKAVNCEHPKDGNPCGECFACRSIDAGSATDVLEMDAASNNGVENIRDIRDEVVYTPSALKYRVYIVDEVHMLSSSAFNALLKTLEEPPSHVIFILATTEFHKLPATIVSRCQRFEFRRIATPTIVSRLTHIADAEGIALEEGAAKLIARLSQGGMRDAISLLDLSSGAEKRITEALVNEAVGASGRDSIARTVRAIAERDFEQIFAEIAEIVTSSKDIATFWQDLIAFYRDMLVVKTTKHPERYFDFTENELSQLSELAKLFPKETLLMHCHALDNALYAMQKANAVKRTIAELTLIKLCDERLDDSNEAILSRVARLEDMVEGGEWMRRSAPPSTTAPTAEQPPVPTAPDKPAAKAATPAAKPTVEPKKPTLKPLKCWIEVADHVADRDIAAAAFVKQAKGYQSEDGRIVVKLNSDFARGMLDREPTRDMLLSALRSCLRREVSVGELSFTVETGGEETQSDSILDEILNG